jgi:hypothetical protein
VQHLKRGQNAPVLLLEIIFLGIYATLFLGEKKTSAGKSALLGHATMRSGACFIFYLNQKVCA